MNKSLKTLLLANSAFVFAFALLGPLYAVFVEQLDSAMLSVSVSWSAFLISSTLFTLLISKFGDRIKEIEFLLIGSYAIRAVVWLLFIFVGSIWQLVILQAILGIGEAMGNPAFDTIFAEHLDTGKHIADYSTWKFIEKLAGAAATLLGGVIVSSFGFAPLFITMSALAFIAAMIILTRPRDLL